MSTPLVWVLFPGAAAVALFFLRRWGKLVVILGCAVSLLLAWLAIRLPAGQPATLSLLPFLPAYQLSDTLWVLGRRFILSEATRPILVFVYLGITLWFGGAYTARAGRMFIPLGLAMAALLTAALAVEPFLYAALLIEMAALISVPVFSPPGQPLRQGTLRFLTMQTLGMPFILFTGWMLEGLQVTPGNPVLAVRAAFLVIFGFSLLSGVFPFHTWLPMLGEISNPFAAAFVFFFLPSFVALFGLEFITRYDWLRSAPGLFITIRTLGSLMVLVGGIMAAFQRNLGRIMGYVAILQTGMSLLALSLGYQPGSALPLSGVFFALLIPRCLGMAEWSLAASLLQEGAAGSRFRHLQGAGRVKPFAAASLLVAHLSLAGFPLLAGFPAQIALYNSLASISLPTALLSLLGIAGLFAAAIRILAVLVMGQSPEPWQITESRFQVALLVTGWLLLLGAGIFPQLFFPAMAGIPPLAGP